MNHILFALLCAVSALAVPVLSVVDLEAASNARAQRVGPGAMLWEPVPPKEPGVAAGAAIHTPRVAARHAGDRPSGPGAHPLGDVDLAGFAPLPLAAFDFDEVTSRAAGPSRLLAAPDAAALLRAGHGAPYAARGVGGGPGRPSVGPARAAAAVSGPAMPAFAGVSEARSAMTISDDATPLTPQPQMGVVDLPPSGVQFGTGLSLLLLWSLRRPFRRPRPRAASRRSHPGPSTRARPAWSRARAPRCDRESGRNGG